MNDLFKNKFNEIFDSLNSDENLPVLNGILFNDEFNETKNSLTIIYNSKINECSKILEELKVVSEEEKIEELEYSKLVINSVPKSGKNKEFETKRNEFYNCYDKFQKTSSLHLKANDFLSEFVAKSLDKCLHSCEKLVSKNEDDLKFCMRDCFKFNQYNTFIMANLMNDEFLKFKNTVEKF